MNYTISTFTPLPMADCAKYCFKGPLKEGIKFATDKYLKNLKQILSTAFGRPLRSTKTLF